MDKILFVSAQPDVPYFIWQIKLYVHNFIQKGINPKQIHIIFSYDQEKNKPSDESLDLIKLGVNISHFKDERERKNYIPSIKPYLIYKWLEKNPEYGKMFFLHDSDIIWNELPNLEKFTQDDIIYLSDTKNYIGYNYLKSASLNYEREFKNCEKEQLINEMCKVIPIDKETIINNQNNSGGGQYIIKNTDKEFWKKVYEDSFIMYSTMMIFQKKFPIRNNKVQFWTAEMWSLLWNLWKTKKETKIIDELDFSWATDTIDNFYKKPILHMAGVTENMKHNKFYKGEFIDRNPIELLKKDENYFNYIDSKSATIKYIENMRSYIQKTNQ